MDAAALDRVYEAFQDFHDYCAPVFGRKQWRERSGQYLQALLVQSQERRNAENLSETVTASPRVLQRFLTEARWDDDAVIGRLQEYLCSRLEHPQAVWVLDGSDFPKQGVKSAGGVPNAHPLHHAGPPHLNVHLHWIHPSHPPKADNQPYRRRRAVQFS